MLIVTFSDKQGARTSAETWGWMGFGGVKNTEGLDIAMESEKELTRETRKDSGRKKDF